MNRGFKNNFLLGAFVLFIGFGSFLYAYKGQPYAEALGIDASSLSTRGWFDVFNSEEKMKEYGIYQLKPIEKAWLKRYLLDHASDASLPNISGLYKAPETYTEDDIKLQ